MESSVIFCFEGRVVGGGNQSIGLQWSIVIPGVEPYIWEIWGE